MIEMVFFGRYFQPGEKYGFSTLCKWSDCKAYDALPD